MPHYSVVFILIETVKTEIEPEVEKPQEPVMGAATSRFSARPTATDSLSRSTTPSTATGTRPGAPVPPSTTSSIHSSATTSRATPTGANFSLSSKCQDKLLGCLCS